MLYGHLLLEQALEILIRARLKRADVLDPGRFARLTFAQKITVYVGLYDPAQERIDQLMAFNRLRKRMAHSFADLEEATFREFPNVSKEIALDTALDIVKFTFLGLIFMELGVIHGARVVVVDDDTGTSPPAEAQGTL